MEKLRFLTPERVREVRARFGTPAYVYDEASLLRQARAVLAFARPHPLTARYAMKAASNAAILRLFSRLGLGIDASSGFECRRALHAGVPASAISLSSQECPEDLEELLALGIQFNACSPAQIESFARARSGGELGLRFNPGLGTGGTNRTNVGGPASSFGIWHETRETIREQVARLGLRAVRIHSHIGSGGDPTVWQRVAGMTLEIVKSFPEVHTVNLGGGFKIARMADETGTDLGRVGDSVREALEAFTRETGRALHLEIEPGTFLVAGAGALVASVHDAAVTGAGGYRFLKLDAGMTEILRPSLYGARHPIVIVPGEGPDREATGDYVVVGHCCESGDILTPAPGDPERLDPRRLMAAQAGDLCVIEGAGAYCSSMAATNYNSFPRAPEILLRSDGSLVLIRRRQAAEAVYGDEVPADLLPGT
ncbi:MAG: diaminopimelate decarboxylase [Puniceicoccaceae bacterium]|nr:MAG: diaminopimelate decarboxylase [Puniceicoccaceae bacterium]